MKNCQDIPNQYISNITPIKRVNSLVDKSIGKVFTKEYEKPNITFNQDLKKKVGPIRYKKDIKNMANMGKKSRKKEKNKNSATKKIDPGNPRKTKVFNNIDRNNLGHK
jgi:hypothetical protein